MLGPGPRERLARGFRSLVAALPEGATKDRMRRVWRLATASRSLAGSRSGGRFPAQPLADVDALVTPNEVVERHGTGVILRRIFGAGAGMLSIRSSTLYPQESFGAAQLRVTHDGRSRSESFERMLHVLNGHRVTRVVCVPYFEGDLISATTPIAQSTPIVLLSYPWSKR